MREIIASVDLAQVVIRNAVSETRKNCSSSWRKNPDSTQVPQNGRMEGANLRYRLHKLIVASTRFFLTIHAFIGV